MIKELERFVTTVERGSFTKAARRLQITQPALSLSIKRLEKTLLKRLFKRVGKRLVLTRDGESLYQVGLRILKLWNNIRSKSVLGHKAYSIGLFDNASLKLSKYFQKNLKENLLEITIDRSATLLQGLEQGIFDLCISIIPQDFLLPKTVMLLKESEETLLAVSKTLWKKSISQVPFILYNKDSETRHYIDRTFFRKGITPTVIVESTDPGFMKELAIRNAGVTLLPKNFVARELEIGKLVIQKFPFVFRRRIGLFLNREGSLKETDEVVKTIIKQLI